MLARLTCLACLFLVGIACGGVPVEPAAQDRVNPVVEVKFRARWSRAPTRGVPSADTVEVRASRDSILVEQWHQKGGRLFHDGPTARGDAERRSRILTLLETLPATSSTFSLGPSSARRFCLEAAIVPTADDFFEEALTIRRGDAVQTVTLVFDDNQAPAPAELRELRALLVAAASE